MAQRAPTRTAAAVDWEAMASKAVAELAATGAPDFLLAEVESVEAAVRE